MRTKTGKVYSKSGYINIRSGLNRYLSSPPHNRELNIMQDKPFVTANKVLKGQLRKNKQDGLVKTHRRSAISKSDLEILGTKYFVLSKVESDPTVLQHKVFYDLVYYMGRRGREGLYELKKDSFDITVESGCIVIRMAYTEATKRGQGDETGQNADDPDDENGIFEQKGDPLCPVRSFKLYLSKLNPANDKFFQRPRAKVSENDDCWYTKQVVGRNSIGEFMKVISKEAGLSKIYTNHCIRKTTITALVRTGQNHMMIPAVSGHKNIESLRKYVDTPTVEERAKFGDALRSYITKQPSATVSKPQDQAQESSANNVIVESGASNDTVVDGLAVGSKGKTDALPPKDGLVIGESSACALLQTQGKADAPKHGLVISGGQFSNCTIQVKFGNDV